MIHLKAKDGLAFCYAKDGELANVSEIGVRKCTCLDCLRFWLAPREDRAKLFACVQERAIELLLAQTSISVAPNGVATKDKGEVK